MYVTFSISVFNCGLSIFNKRILLLYLASLLQKVNEMEWSHQTWWKSAERPS